VNGYKIIQVFDLLLVYIMRQLKPNQPTPTLYEIRSLGLIEHEQRGGNPQALAGHSRSMQTLTYLRGHDVTKKVQSI